MPKRRTETVPPLQINIQQQAAQRRAMIASDGARVQSSWVFYLIHLERQVHITSYYLLYPSSGKNFDVARQFYHLYPLRVSALLRQKHSWIMVNHYPRSREVWASEDLDRQKKTIKCLGDLTMSGVGQRGRMVLLRIYWVVAEFGYIVKIRATAEAGSRRFKFDYSVGAGSKRPRYRNRSKNR